MPLDDHTCMHTLYHGTPGEEGWEWMGVDGRGEGRESDTKASPVARTWGQSRWLFIVIKKVERSVYSLLLSPPRAWRTPTSFQVWHEQLAILGVTGETLPSWAVRKRKRKKNTRESATIISDLRDDKATCVAIFSPPHTLFQIKLIGRSYC